MSGESVVRKVINQETSRRERTRQKGAVCFEHDDSGGDRHRVRLSNTSDGPGAVTVTEPDARTYEDALPELVLPGSGDELEDCGDDLPRLLCVDCGDPKKIGRTCSRSRCPRCWQSWAFRRAKTAAAKVEAKGRERGNTGEKVKQHHVTISFRDTVRFNTSDPVKRGFEAIKRLAQVVNIDTGLAVYHPYRIKHEHRGSVLGHDSGDGEMTWKDILEIVETEGWDTARDYLEYSPHFHLICLSVFVQCGAVTRDLEAKTGVVIERIATKREDGKTRSIAGPDELCRVVAYAYSHAGIEQGEHGNKVAARFFGELANYTPYEVKNERTGKWEKFEDAVIDPILREVSHTVLGVDFTTGDCDAPHPGHRDIKDGEPATTDTGLPEHVATASSSSGTVGTGDGDTDTSDHVATRADTGTDREPEPCGGQVRPIWLAEKYLGDLEWVNRIEEQYGEERLHELRKAVLEWQEHGTPPPE